MLWLMEVNGMRYRHLLGELSAVQIAEYGKRKNELLQTYCTTVKPMIEVIKFLNHLSICGIRMTVATSAGKDRAYETLEKLGIPHYFETIVKAMMWPSGDVIP
jgi:phosphoglycolate phosphatase-like HAD superfamily hydrolase